MDGTQSTPKPELQAASTELSAERSLASTLEAKVAPAAVEASQNGPRADDGAAVAQAQVAVVATDDDDEDQGQVAPVAPPAAGPVPLTAADVDVIEPEWVKKAEEAVAANRDNPRAEEDAVEAVQIEYLKKRYNLDVKPGDEKP